MSELQTANKGKGPDDIGPFTKIPNKLFSSGLASQLGSSATLVYVALCEHYNRDSENEFVASNKALASETGLSDGTINNARTKLVAAGLVQCSRGKGRSFTYSILRQNLSWKSLDSRLRVKLRPRGRQRPNVSADTFDDYPFKERAAIMEYCGNIPRPEVERILSGGSIKF